MGASVDLEGGDGVVQGMEKEQGLGQVSKYGQFVYVLLLVKNWQKKVLQKRISTILFNHPKPPTIQDQMCAKIFKNQEKVSRSLVDIGSALSVSNSFSGKLEVVLSIFTIDTTGSLYYYWCCLVAIASFYNLIFMVINIYKEFADIFFEQWLSANFICDGIYAVDFLLNFRIEFLDNGLLITDRKELFYHYLLTRQCLHDFLKIIPVDYLFTFVWPQSASIIALTRVNRILMSHKILEFYDKLEMVTSYPLIVRLLRLVTLNFVIFHWVGCIYFWISTIYGYEEADLEDWVFSSVKINNPLVPNCDARFPVKSKCYMHESAWMAANRHLTISSLNSYYALKTHSIEFNNLVKKYLLCYYWSSLTLVTLGEQASPRYTPQTIFETLVTIVGVCVFAAILGNVGNMVTSSNAVKTKYNEQLDNCKQYMRFRHVDFHLQKKVCSWFDYMWVSNCAKVDEDTIADFLPDRLYGQLAIHNHMETMTKVPLFKDCEDGLLYEIILRLKQVVFSPGDYICKKGDIGKEMYVVHEGCLEVVSEDGKVVFFTINKGSVIGELALLNIPGSLKGNKRTASIRSVGYSQLYSLTKEQLWECIHEFPNAKETLIEKGKEILRKDKFLIENVVDDGFEMCQSVEETFTLLQKQCGKIKEELDGYTTSFNESTKSVKKRLTSLERNFSLNKQTFKTSGKKFSTITTDNCDILVIEEL
uniref:Cyclic nucleotide-binding domain-containing protein n=1 Tax=Rhabditophanes sp. KR3021 TaxID=114890 RepID=A0AC35UHN5_9BILA